MADQSKYILSRLFIAVPELQIDSALLKILSAQGLVTQGELDAADEVRRRSKKYAAIAQKMRGKTLIERIMLVAPEVMSVAAIDAFRRWGLISPTLGNALRVGLRGGKALAAGIVAEKTAMERWSALGQAALTNDTINLLRDLDNARIRKIRAGDPDGPSLEALMQVSIRRGNILRSLLSTGRISADTLSAARNANTVWGVLTVVAEGLLSDRLLKDAIRVGAISQGRYELIRALEKLGLNVWKKGAAGVEYESWAARALLMSEGVLSPEMINALRVAGIISPRLALLLYPASAGIRRITRGQLDHYRAGIRARIVPGEAPIKSYARITAATDKEILRLLAESARDANKSAEKLAKSGKFGSLTREAQQRLIEREMHLQMRALWEGVGHLTIFGEKEAARAAIYSMDFLQDRLWNAGGASAKDFRRSIRRSAEAGVDAYISRQENLQPLSRRIYKNDLLGRGRVSATINKGLLRGLSARELAQEVSGLIRPGVPGGVSYSAQRLARTEINNAFHFNSIRYTREQPWVTGYRWNLSGSHGRIDVCNTMSQRNHDGIGRGVYKKANVPGKPHPHCLCYITTVTAGAGVFERQLRNGSYDKYLKGIERSGFYPEANTFTSIYRQQASQLASYATSVLAVRAGRYAARHAVQAAVLGGFSLRMTMTAGGRASARDLVKGKFNKAKYLAVKGQRHVDLDADTFWEEDLISDGKPTAMGRQAQDAYGSNAYQPWNRLLRKFNGNLSDIEAAAHGIVGREFLQALENDDLDIYERFLSEDEYNADGSLNERKALRDLMYEARTGSLADLTRAFDGQFGKTKYDSFVYRVSSQGWAQGATDFGEAFTDDAYASTEAFGDLYKNFADWQGSDARYRIFVPKGTPAALGNSDMDEMVLGRGLKYRIISKTAIPGNAWDYEVEALP